MNKTILLVEIFPSRSRWIRARTALTNSEWWIRWHTATIWISLSLWDYKSLLIFGCGRLWGIFLLIDGYGWLSIKPVIVICHNQIWCVFLRVFFVWVKFFYVNSIFSSFAIKLRCFLSTSTHLAATSSCFV